MGSVRALVGLLILVPGLATSAWAAEPPVASTAVQSNRAISVDPIAPFQAWLDAWTRATSPAARSMREAALPAEPEPGLDLRINPDDESVYLGWRARF